MPWASHAVRQKFQALVNQVVALHDQFGKSKNQEDFSNLRVALEIALDFLYEKKLPDGADQKLSSIAGGITQTLVNIGSKKSGSESNAEFIKMLLDADKESIIFRNTCEQEIRSNLLQSDNTENELQRALTITDSKDQLAEKISSLGAMPIQVITPYSFFKRATSHYPTTTIGSVVTGTIGLSYAGLNILSHYLGNPLDLLLHADTTGITHKAVIATVLLITATTLGTAASVKTCLSLREENNEEELSERSRLLRV